MIRANTVILLSVAGSFFAGCAVKTPVDVEELPPTAAGSASEHIVDNSDVAFYTTGEWGTSQSAAGYQGNDYSYAAPGSGSSVATWNLNIIKSFDVFAKWTAHPNRGSNVKFVIHHLDNGNNLVTETVTVDQRESGGEWVKLGTYRMSALTGRVTVSDDADGYVIADAVLFREVGAEVPAETGDTDGDGIPDSWEQSFGMDPNDPSDASLDQDNDGLSALDEFILQTDPTTADTDSDGMPDGYETSAGLDPTVDDATKDPDGDGVSSYDEYAGGTDPNDPTSTPSISRIQLTWTTPTERVDGTPLAESEIAKYEIIYQEASLAKEIIVDNSSPEFLTYGSGAVESTSTNGYIGSNYLALPAGSGEISAEWNVANLNPGTEYILQANWTSHPNRATNAQYQYTITDDSGSQIRETAIVNQQSNGGSWQLLGTFVSSDPSLTVRVDNNTDGYVIADAIKVEAAPAGESIIIEAGTENRFIVSGLPEGEWQFQIRAIDSNGLTSDYSAAKSQVIE